MIDTGRHFTILIVDDSVVSLTHLQKILNKTGYTVLSAGSGNEAIAAIDTVLPDLILLDIMMPGMDGFEVIRWLKSKPRTGHIPVIFLTGNDDEASKMTAFDLGAVDYIVKPFNPQEVKARVSVHLKIAVALQDAIETQADKIRQIHDAQQAILIKPQELPDARFSVYFRSVLEAGGDFYDVLEQAGGLYTFLVADVAGHDISTSYIHPALKALFRQNCAPIYTLDETVVMMNRVLTRILPAEKYLSACFLTVNRNAGKVSWVNAGHPPALFLPKNGEPEFLEGDGELIGISEGSLYRSQERSFCPGDRIVLYTDGLVEWAENTSVWASEYRKLLPCALQLADLPLVELPQRFVEKYLPDRERIDDDIIVLCIDL